VVDVKRATPNSDSSQSTNQLYHVYVKSEHNHALGKPMRSGKGRAVDLTSLHPFGDVDSTETVYDEIKTLGLQKQRLYPSGKIYFRCEKCKQFSVWAVPRSDNKYTLYTNSASGQHPLPCLIPPPVPTKRPVVRRVEKTIPASRDVKGSIEWMRNRMVKNGFHLIGTFDTHDVETLRKQQHVKFNGTICAGGAQLTYNCRRYCRPRSGVRCFYQVAVLTEVEEKYSVYSKGEHNHPLKEPPTIRSTDFTFCRQLNSKEEIAEFTNSGYKYATSRAAENREVGERVCYYRCVVEGCPRRMRLDCFDLLSGENVLQAKRARLYERGQHNHD